MPDETKTSAAAPVEDFGSWELCDLCDGTGEYGEWYCPDCKGRGMVYEEGWDDDFDA